jgi:hypothetical protein
MLAEGVTLVHLTAKSKDVRTLRELDELTAAPDNLAVDFAAQDNEPQWTPLHFAAKAGDAECLAVVWDLMRKHGRAECLDSKDARGRTALTVALEHQHPSCAQYLLSHGALSAAPPLAVSAQSGPRNSTGFGEVSGQNIVRAGPVPAGSRSDGPAAVQTAPGCCAVGASTVAHDQTSRCYAASNGWG